MLQAKAGSLLLPKEQQQAHNDRALEREAARFVTQLGELKGAYVKIGQMLALYGEHILPPQVTNALHTLESATTPLEWDAIQLALEEQLGSHRLSDLNCDSAPIAAASLSQVHRASLAAIDAPVCVKVQYPNIADAIEDDFKNVMQMLSLARWVKPGRQLESLTKDLKRYLLEEVDYHNELHTAELVRTRLQGDRRYVVPQFYPHYCTDKVLTMEYIAGLDVMDKKVQSLSQERRNRLAEAMLELFFKEAFEWRLMQTDPNFGNYRILLDERDSNDQLVLLDFGAVHELSEAFSESLRSTILAAQNHQTSAVIQGLEQLNCLRETDSDEVKQSFAQFCEYILEPFRHEYDSVPDYALAGHNYDWKQSRLLKRAGRVGSQSVLVKGFAVPPPEFMLMVRKLTGVFTFVSALGAKTRSSDLLNSYRVIT